MKTIQCINNDGIQVEFNYKEDAPFFLESLEGVYSFENDVNTSDRTMTDGAQYQSSLTRKRNIVITAHIDGEYQERRNLLYKCFKQGCHGLFRHIEDEVVKDIDYVTESVVIEPQGVIRIVTISLLCADPHFKDPYDTEITMAGWEDCFEWPHEFVKPEEITRRKSELIKEINNEGTVKYTGMEIKLKANAAVSDPVINHVEDGTFIRIYKTMKPGEQIRIVTKSNDKSVYFIDVDGNETEINDDIDEDSTFIQLIEGPNNIQYDAATGVEHLDVSLAYRTMYIGV